MRHDLIRTAEYWQRLLKAGEFKKILTPNNMLSFMAGTVFGLIFWLVIILQIYFRI